MVGFGGFGIGRLSSAEPRISTYNVEEINTKEAGLVVASKSGSKYHYPWCGGAARIKEENKIIFSDIEDAKAAGYSKALNCKGLK